jgi:hypothetical protein
MAPLDFGPYLCPLNSPSFLSLQPWIHTPIALWRLMTVPREHRSARKLLKDLASPTGFEPVLPP